MNIKDLDAAAYPTQNEWPDCGLTKLQLAAVMIAAGIAKPLSQDRDIANVEAKRIARSARLIAAAILEDTCP